MKTIKSFFAVLMTFVYMTSFSSCGNDNDEPSTPAAKSIEGTYIGDLQTSVMGSVSMSEDLTFTISAIDEHIVAVTLPAFGEAPMALPSITIPGVRVSESDGVVTLAETEVSGSTEAGKAYTCTLIGVVEKNLLTIKYNLTYGAMPMPLICSVSASKQ